MAASTSSEDEHPDNEGPHGKGLGGYDRGTSAASPAVAC